MAPEAVAPEAVTSPAQISKKRKLESTETMTEPVLKVKLLSEKGIVPTRGSELAAGYDIYTVEDAIIKAHDRAMVDTDIAVAIPPLHYGRIAGRSGLATKHGIQPGAGVVDADYRGPLKILLFNHSSVDFEVKAGDRVAQMVIERIITPEIVTVDALDETVRGEKGFGSTGGFGARAELPAEIVEKTVIEEQVSEPVAASPDSVKA